MTIIGWIQILLYCAIVVALVKPLGAYMTHVFNGERTLLSPVLRPVERAIYWAGGVDEKREQSWLMYAVGMLLFHVGGFLILYVLMRFQAVLPFNPAEMSAVPGGPLLQHGRRASSPTPTGRTTAARARCRTWCRCSASRTRTSCRRQPASCWRWR